LGTSRLTSGDRVVPPRTCLTRSWSGHRPLTRPVSNRPLNDLSHRPALSAGPHYGRRVEHMELSLVLVLVLAVVVGITLGPFGGGGSLLMVPLLTYVAGTEPKEAIAASLFIVGVTSLISTFAHTRAGNVRWRTGVVFGAAGMVGAFLGGLVGGHLPGALLMIAFALMMVATAVSMLRGRKNNLSGPGEEPRSLPLRRVVLDGSVVGVITGLVGAGGGFLVVPALALLGGLAMPAAVGTSLLVIAMKSFAGLAGYMATVSVDWT